MLKLAVAGALALAFSTAAAPAKTALFVDHRYVKMVSCDLGKGTAFQIAPGRYLSVAHVTRLGRCHINGQEVTIEHQDDAADFSIITIPEQVSGGIAINCDGFVNGEAYWALGYAMGAPVIRAIVIRADGFRTMLQGGGKWIVFNGTETVIPGMSGGPVLGSDGRVVGVINAYNSHTVSSFSRPLAETAVCK